MMRPIVPDDTPSLLALAQETGVFKPLEIEALREVLDDFHAGLSGEGHRAVAYDQDGRVIGFAYYAPASMTERTWYLYWIVVGKPIQSQGIGGALLHHVEANICRARGRLLLIETSSLPHYERTHRFYRKHGYAPAAVLPDYYADGDDLLIFGKRLGS